MLSIKLLEDIIKKYEDLNEKLSTVSDTKELVKMSKEQRKVEPQAVIAKKIITLSTSITQNQELLDSLGEGEDEIKNLTREDNGEKELEIKNLEGELLEYLVPTDSRDDNNIILEIRAGAGGDESSLFAAEIFRMYDYLCQQLGFKIKILSTSNNNLGGHKEMIAEIRGDNVFSWFKYESGVHRVQRVPATEKQGRIHTSTASVAVLSLIEEGNEFKLDMKEVEVIASTSQGAGGQSVNTTYSAIKAKHLPTGIEAQSQDERNQQQNKIKALQVLTSRVFDHYEELRLEKETLERRQQVGRADRSEKIRTYNYPQDRVTDHRYNLNYTQLPSILGGGVIEIIKDIRKSEAKKTIADLNV